VRTKGGEKKREEMIAWKGFLARKSGGWKSMDKKGRRGKQPERRGLVAMGCWAAAEKRKASIANHSQGSRSRHQQQQQLRRNWGTYLKEGRVETQFDVFRPIVGCQKIRHSINKRPLPSFLRERGQSISERPRMGGKHMTYHAILKPKRFGTFSP